MKCDHIKRLITFTSDYNKRLSLYIIKMASNLCTEYSLTIPVRKTIEHWRINWGADSRNASKNPRIKHIVLFEMQINCWSRLNVINFQILSGLIGISIKNIVLNIKYIYIKLLSLQSAAYFPFLYSICQKSREEYFSPKMDLYFWIH